MTTIDPSAILSTISGLESDLETAASQINFLKVAGLEAEQEVHNAAARVAAFKETTAKLNRAVHNITDLLEDMRRKARSLEQ